jgi:transcription initiation factor TFIIH subunit 3
MRTRARTQVVDYRASCFCHKAIIDTGYICSVCLSIFCKANMKAPQCLTCGAPFKSKGGAAGGGAGGAGAAAAASSAAA